MIKEQLTHLCALFQPRYYHVSVPFSKCSIVKVTYHAANSQQISNTWQVTLEWGLFQTLCRQPKFKPTGPSSEVLKNKPDVYRRKRGLSRSDRKRKHTKQWDIKKHLVNLAIFSSGSVVSYHMYNGRNTLRSVMDNNIEIENLHAYRQFSKSFSIHRYISTLCILQRSEKSLTKPACTVTIQYSHRIFFYTLL